MGSSSFGQYLKKAREEKDISQRRLAELSGISNAAISKIEAGAVNPDPITLEKLAGALSIEKELLLIKCGYSEVPEEFVVLARKTGELTEDDREKVYCLLNRTIDKFLDGLDDDEED